MSSTNFLIKTHTFPGQHIRHYAGATRNQGEDTQYLEAKQYVPLDNQSPSDGDITVIAAHAASFPKENYEPLWDDLLAQSRLQGFRIRSIWIADASNQGASGILNEHTLGDDPSASDNARDILVMVNTFRMPQPLVGIGHSMGATALTKLSLMHPRLFASLVLLDPVVGAHLSDMGRALLYSNLLRPDIWLTQADAETMLRKTFKTWDPRVLDRFVSHGLRDTPTSVHPEPGNVTLRTTRANEAWSYARPSWDTSPADDSGPTQSERILHPGGTYDLRPFCLPEPVEVWHDLPRLQPDVFFIFPEKGPGCTPKTMSEKIKRTGVADGGNGGAKDGRVESCVVKGTGHLLAFEKPAECARVVAAWLGKDLKAWKARVEFERANRYDKSVDGIALSEEWRNQVRTFHEAGRRGRLKASKL